jgi:acyl-CoA synthetase (NDP forming)
MKKPVLCLKGGRSPESAGALASHTGSLAADDRLYEGLFRQTGVVTVDDYRDLLDCAKPFLYQPLPTGNGLGIISFSGAIGIQCIDAARLSGLIPAKLSVASQERLSRIHPLMGGHPIDLGPAMAVAGLEVFDFYRKSYETLMEDNAVDCIYFNAYVSALVKPEHYSEFFEYISEHREKPAVMWCYGSSGEHLRELAVLAETFRIPCYETTRKAVRALGYMHRYAAWKRSRGREDN